MGPHRWIPRNGRGPGCVYASDGVVCVRALQWIGLSDEDREGCLPLLLFSASEGAMGCYRGCY